MNAAMTVQYWKLIVTSLVVLAQPVLSQSIFRSRVGMTVGANVQVSKAFPELPHHENLSAGDPEHPGRLISCSQVFPPDIGKSRSQYCYVSFDNGQTWVPTLKITNGLLNADPTVGYGFGEDVYVVTINLTDFAKPQDPDPEARQGEAATVVYKSSDGGRTWKESARFPALDREYISIDKTKGKYAGRIYVEGLADIKGISGSLRPSLQLFRSLDGGKTFLGPVSAEFSEGTGPAGGIDNSAVLADGTLVVMFRLTKLGRKAQLEQEPSLGPNCELHVISSKDGGESFGASQKIADFKSDFEGFRGSTIGQLAVDPGSKLFPDRLYAVFPAIVSGRTQVLLSHSADKGKTWSKPVIVNDDRSPERRDNGPDHLLPSVAVNRDGIVLITWYDRREAKDDRKWRLRAAASLDGGETFSASAPVSEALNDYSTATPWELKTWLTRNYKASLVSLSVLLDPFFFTGGDTSGLAVDANGTFHPTWIDNRTGVAQLWSASVKVSGTAFSHGDSILDGLVDLSNSVTVRFSKPVFDRVTGALTIDAQIENTSENTIRAPLKLRVLTLESQHGVPEILNSDNGQNGTGAVWEFRSSSSDNTLGSMALSTSKTLRLRLSDASLLGQAMDFDFTLVNLDMRIFGQLSHK